MSQIVGKETENLKITNINHGKAEEGEYTFSSVRKEILRDEILLLSPHNSDTRQFYAGVATVYPGCRSRGHAHKDSEEICFVTKGNGIVIAEEEKREIEAGDLVYISKAEFHQFRNPHQTALDLFFVISPPKAGT